MKLITKELVASERKLILPWSWSYDNHRSVIDETDYDLMAEMLLREAQEGFDAQILKDLAAIAYASGTIR